MNCLMEALGLALPFNGTALAQSRQSAKRWQQQAAGLILRIDRTKPDPAPDRHHRSHR